MTGALTVWSHALVALIFGAAAASGSTRAPGLPHRAFVIALGATALWALAVAGIDGRDLAARLAETGRNLAWLGFTLALVRRDRSGGWGLTVVHGVVMVVTAAAAVLAIVASAVHRPGAAEGVTATLVLFRMMTAASALVLVRDLLAGMAARERGGVRLVTVGLAGLWALDLTLYTAGYLFPGEVAALVAGRGLLMIPVALLIAAGARRGGDWTLSLSRTVATRSLTAVALALYAGLVVLFAGLAERMGGQYSRPAQTAIILGAATALATWLSTPWLRSWAQVMVAKHLFRHRYDYRAEWQRFAETLGKPGEGAPPLATRIVKAVAEMTGSPAGLLLLADGPGLTVGGGWAWDADAMPAGHGDEAIARYLADSRRIIEIDDIRADAAPTIEAAAVPQWMVDRAEGWALVPLFHVEALVGAILLARPLVGRKLDWEDLDLLRVAGRQAASYLAEERAHTALADVRRFDEFNRRFAFILHDVKNLASQLSLVARNAERHADNPEFRTDMIATLRSSADQMTTLLARLSQQAAPRSEPRGPVDLAGLAERVAGARRAGHPVTSRATGSVWVEAEAGRLEQVLHHLVQNAVEASPPAEPVLLSVAEEDGRAVVEVADRGCGMAPAFLRDQLFRPFVSTKPGGFGIGAFEARQLVEAMGGQLQVTSREGEGTRFRILLPRLGLLERAA